MWIKAQDMLCAWLNTISCNVSRKQWAAVKAALFGIIILSGNLRDLQGFLFSVWPFCMFQSVWSGLCCEWGAREAQSAWQWNHSNLAVWESPSWVQRVYGLSAFALGFPSMPTDSWGKNQEVKSVFWGINKALRRSGVYVVRVLHPWLVMAVEGAACQILDLWLCCVNLVILYWCEAEWEFWVKVSA